jgi:uncharacterized membrane protein YbhN (UPF0104 family)
MPTADPITANISWAAVARRARVPAAAAALLIAAAIVVGGPARHLLDALERAYTADPRWVLGAAGFEVLSFVGYIALLSHVAGGVNDRFGFKQSYRTTLAGAAVTRLLPTAGAGGAALTLWVLGKSGHKGRAGVRTLLTFLVVLYAVFLLAIVVSGVAAAGLGSGATLALSLIPAAGAGLAMLVAVGLAFRAPKGEGRISRAGATLGEAVRDAAVLIRGRDVRLLGAVAWWGFDVCVLWAVFNAVGTAPPVGVLVLGYFLGQVANTIPVPGAASGGLVGVMLAFGVEADLALAGVLAYRSIAIWLPAPFGAHALAGLRREAARWSAEDEHEIAGHAEPAGIPGDLRRIRLGSPAHAHQPLAA